MRDDTGGGSGMHAPGPRRSERTLVRRLSQLLVLVFAGITLVPALAADDPAIRPSIIAPLASQSLLVDLARAGNRLFAAGERGHVLYSTDDGKSWQQVQVPGSANLTAIYFADERHGWAVGHAEMILRTEDGGDHWERVHFAPENQQPLLDIWFADVERGIAVGAYGAFYASSDGGRTWTAMPFKPEGMPGAAPVEPGDEHDEGFEAGYDFHLNAIAQAADGGLYLAAEAGRLFRSDDVGQSWQELPSPYDGSFYGVLPLDGPALLAFGLRGHLYRSEDRGQHWTPIDTGTVALLNSAVRVDANTVVIVGMAGTVLVSRDGGSTFSLTRLGDRKAISAVLARADGQLITAGEDGVRRLAVPQ